MWHCQSCQIIKSVIAAFLYVWNLILQQLLWVKSSLYLFEWPLGMLAGLVLLGTNGKYCSKNYLPCERPSNNGWHWSFSSCYLCLHSSLLQYQNFNAFFEGGISILDNGTQHYIKQPIKTGLFWQICDSFITVVIE